MNLQQVAGLPLGLTQLTPAIGAGALVGGFSLVLVELRRHFRLEAQREARALDRLPLEVWLAGAVLMGLDLAVRCLFALPLGALCGAWLVDLFVNDGSTLLAPLGWLWERYFDWYTSPLGFALVTCALMVLPMLRWREDGAKSILWSLLLGATGIILPPAMIGCGLCFGPFIGAVYFHIEYLPLRDAVAGRIVAWLACPADLKEAGDGDPLEDGWRREENGAWVTQLAASEHMSSDGLRLWRLSPVPSLGTGGGPPAQGPASAAAVELTIDPLLMMYLHDDASLSPRSRMVLACHGRLGLSRPVHFRFSRASREHKLDVNSTAFQHPAVDRSGLALTDEGLSLKLWPMPSSQLHVALESAARQVEKLMSGAATPWMVLRSRHGLSAMQGNDMSAEGVLVGVGVKAWSRARKTHIEVSLAIPEAVRVRPRRGGDDSEGGVVGDLILDSKLFFEGDTTEALSLAFARDQTRGVLLDVLCSHTDSSLHSGHLRLVVHEVLGEEELCDWVTTLVTFSEDLAGVWRAG